MDNKEFKQLLDRYTKGLLDKQEMEHLEKWLDTMEDKTAFDNLSQEELSTAREDMFSRLQQRIGQPAKTVRMLRPSQKIAVAATIAVIIVAGYFWRKSVLDIVAPHRTTYAYSDKGHIRKQILSDGSIVWLKGKSKLTFPAVFNQKERPVTLEGEALFEVAKDAKRPFVVRCGSLTTGVLGTSFNIRKNEKGEVAISVLTGSVVVASKSTKEQIIKTNESIVYSEVHASVVNVHPSRTDIHGFIRGTEYDMAFNDARMIDVIQKIEKKFEVKINLEDTAIQKQLFTADMTDQSLEHTMEMISQALNLDITINDKTVLIRPKK
ncbi:FecR family protein [Chitinophaga filiformis]|uniref:FecR domain-containing protein n=1 Tax=Chitinophaga filiformis TaxID=104663 RepID=A0ABY4I0P3_CHIFI|nr:FecR domain-containing protein [Chitinophaga filiformis]UPK69372.1 FecR domain-containing protein [Chitinophaga filiformis]